MSSKNQSDKKPSKDKNEPTTKPTIPPQYHQKPQSQSVRPPQNYHQQPTAAPRKGLGSRGK